MKQEQPRKSFLQKVGTFAVTRVRNPVLFNRSRKNLSESTTAATSSLVGADLNVEDFKAGLRGRYSDGGVARFAQMLHRNGLTLDMADDIRGTHLRAGLIFAAAAVAMLCFGLYSVSTATSTVSMFAGGSLSIIFFLFMALAIRHDFAAWQIGARRFGGFREYLEFRLG